jgi:hypothetical protein
MRIYYMNIYNAMAASLNLFVDLDLNVYHAMTLIFVKHVSTQDYFILIKIPFLRRRIQKRVTDILSQRFLKILIRKIKFNLIKKQINLN